MSIYRRAHHVRPGKPTILVLRTPAAICLTWIYRDADDAVTCVVLGTHTLVEARSSLLAFGVPVTTHRVLPQAWVLSYRSRREFKDAHIRRKGIMCIAYSMSDFHFNVCADLYKSLEQYWQMREF